ncbi:MAG: hypothetical protein RIS20_562 [Bacteroidota bacterium]|jgi:uncharacterized protein YjbI with pentapeptide repeats
MITPKSIGLKLTAARKSKNFLQATLAQELAVSAQAVGKWERGESLPDIIQLNRIADLLGLDLNYFSEKDVAMIAAVEPKADLAEVTTDIKESDKKKRHNWNMSDSNWINVDFSGIKNIQENFHSAHVKKCQFNGADLSNVHMKSNNFDQCDFLNAKLVNMSIQKTNIAHCSLKGVNLKETEFLKSFISSSDFAKTDLSKVLFEHSGLEKLNLGLALLSRTAFVNTRLSNVQFSGSLDRCSFEKCAFYKVTFHKAKLTQTFFKYNDLKRVTFIDCEADHLTYELLKHGKADLTGIKLV